MTIGPCTTPCNRAPATAGLGGTTLNDPRSPNFSRNDPIAIKLGGIVRLVSAKLPVKFQLY